MAKYILLFELDKLIKLKIHKDNVNIVSMEETVSQSMKIYMPSIAQINLEVTTMINQTVLYHLEQILKQLTHDHRLNFEQIKDQYLRPLKEVFNDSVHPSESQHPKKKIIAEEPERCSAFTASKKQCRKKKTVRGEFCTIHTDRFNVSRTKDISEDVTRVYSSIRPLVNIMVKDQ